MFFKRKKTLLFFFCLALFVNRAQAGKTCILEPMCYGLRSAPNHKTFGLTLGIEKEKESKYPNETSESLTNILNAKECFLAAIQKAQTLEELTRKFYDPSLADDENYIDHVACYPFVKWSFVHSSRKYFGKVTRETRYISENNDSTLDIEETFSGDQRYKYQDNVSKKIVPLIP